MENAAIKLCWQPYQIAFGHAAERCCVLGTTPAGWYEEEQDLVGKGCDCQCCAPAGLENHPGGKGFGHMSSECVRIVLPRDCEENTLDAFAEALEKLPGLTLVFPRNSKDIEAKDRG